MADGFPHKCGSEAASFKALRSLSAGKPFGGHHEPRGHSSPPGLPATGVNDQVAPDEQVRVALDEIVVVPYVMHRPNRRPEIQSTL